MQTTSGPSRRTALTISACAAILALATHAYLAFVHFDVQFGQATGDRICNIGDKFDCEAVSASRFSELLSIPLAIWGFAINSAFLILLGLWAISEPEQR